MISGFLGSSSLTSSSSITTSALIGASLFNSEATSSLSNKISSKLSCSSLSSSSSKTLTSLINGSSSKDTSTDSSLTSSIRGSTCSFSLFNPLVDSIKSSSPMLSISPIVAFDKPWILLKDLRLYSNSFSAFSSSIRFSLDNLLLVRFHSEECYRNQSFLL